MKKVIYPVWMLLNAFSVLSAADGVKPGSFFEADPILPAERGSVSSVVKTDDGILWMGWANLLDENALFDQPLGFVRNDTFRKLSNFPFVSPKRVFEMIHTDKGLLVASDAGLLLYDGNIWTKTAGLPSDYIRCVAVQGDYTLVGTDQGVVLMHNGQMLHLHQSNSLLPTNAVRCVELDDKGGIYAGTKAGFFVKTPLGEQVFSKANGSLDGDAIQSLLFYNEQVWVSQTDFQSQQKLYVFDLATNALMSPRDISNCYKGLMGREFIRFIKGPDHSFWMVTKDDFNNNQTILIRVQNEKMTTYSLEAMYFGGLTAPLCMGENGSLLFVSFLGAAYSWNPVDYIIYPGWTSRSVQYLEVNNVRAPIIPHSEMFWTKEMANPTYEVPKNSCLSTAFVTGLWIGGKDQNSQLRLAASTYGQSGSDYTFGVLNPSTGKADTALSNALKLNEPRVVWKRDIDAFKKAWSAGEVQNGSFQIPPSILSWPGNRGNSNETLAPFVDLNSDGFYRPLEGDYPAIKGDQCIFHVFHDDIFHMESGMMGLGIEIHVLSYAFNCSDISEEDPKTALNYSTFHEYRIINFSVNDYTEVQTGIFADMAIGNPFDDYVGCDTNLQAGFVYNADNSDEFGYGDNPPTQAVVFYRDKMDVFAAYGDDFSNKGIPTYGPHFYNYMKGLYKNGDPLEGEGGVPTKHQFSGALYKQGSYTDSMRGDKRFVMATDRGAFKSKDTLELAFAMVYSRDNKQANGYGTSYQRMLRDIQNVRQWTATGTFPSCDGPALGEEKHSSSGRIELYPNPGTQLVNIAGVLQGEVYFEVYTLDGRRVKSGSLPEGNRSLEMADLIEGVYLIRLSGDQLQWSGKWLKTQKN